MGTSFSESQYRMGAGFTAQGFLAILNTIVRVMGFEADKLYDLVLEFTKGERKVFEVILEEISSMLQNQAWDEMYQIIVSNHWEKGSNFKMHATRRQGFTAVTLKYEISNKEQRKLVVEALEQEVARSFTRRLPSEQTKDQVLKQMFLSDALMQLVREPFLAGNYHDAILSAYDAITRKLESVLEKPMDRIPSLASFLAEEPPRLLLPSFSGAHLLAALRSLGSIFDGVRHSVQHVYFDNQADSQSLPDFVKHLVMLSFIWERLENAYINPLAPVPPTVQNETLTEPIQSVQEKNHPAQAGKRKSASLPKTSKKNKTTFRSASPKRLRSRKKNNTKPGN